jgi:molybdopterin synthase sulfur carrier subunit
MERLARRLAHLAVVIHRRDNRRRARRNLIGVLSCRTAMVPAPLFIPMGVLKPSRLRSDGATIAMAAPLSILYFAWLRERVGVSDEVVSPPESVVTVADLVIWLANLDLRHAAAFKDQKSVRCAVNQEFADTSTVLCPGDEVAFFPPVTGG